MRALPALANSQDSRQQQPTLIRSFTIWIFICWMLLSASLTLCQGRAGRAKPPFSLLSLGLIFLDLAVADRSIHLVIWYCKGNILLCWCFGTRGGIRVLDEPEKPDFRFPIPFFPPKIQVNPDFFGFYAWFSEHSVTGFIKTSLSAPPLLGTTARFPHQMTWPAQDRRSCRRRTWRRAQSSWRTSEGRPSCSHQTRGMVSLSEREEANKVQSDLSPLSQSFITTFLGHTMGLSSWDINKQWKKEQDSRCYTAHVCQHQSVNVAVQQQKTCSFFHCLDINSHFVKANCWIMYYVVCRAAADLFRLPGPHVDENADEHLRYLRDRDRHRDGTGHAQPVN